MKTTVGESDDDCPLGCHAMQSGVSEKQWHLATRLHGVTQLKTVFFNTNEIL